MTAKSQAKKGSVRAKRSSQEEFIRQISGLLEEALLNSKSREDKRREATLVLEEVKTALKNREDGVESNAVFVIRNNKGSDTIHVSGVSNAEPIWAGVQLLKALRLDNPKSLLELVTLMRELKERK